MEIQIQPIHGHPRSLLRILPRTANHQQEATEADIKGAAPTIDEGERWIQANNNLRYVLVTTTTGAAATLRRQPSRPGRGNRIGNLPTLPTTVPTCCNTSWNKERCLPNKAPEANIPRQCRGVVRRVQAQQVRGEQRNTTPRQRTYCRAHEPNNRTTAAPLPQRWQSSYAEAGATIMDHKSATAFQWQQQQQQATQTNTAAICY